MLNTDKSQNNIINAWQTLIEQSVKANSAFLEESAKIFTSLLSKKTDTKDLLNINSEVLNAAANNFIKLNITNTENLVNFGLSLSRSFLSFVDIKTDPGTGSAPEPEPALANARSQINMSVKQGERISTSFYLNSHNAFSQTGRFYYEDFINEATGEKAAIGMLISPKEFTLEPGKSLKIDVSIDATGNIHPAKYKSIVRLDGMDNQEFDIVVHVTENTPAIAKISKHKPLIKKAVLKKPLKKTSGKR